jgi:hypothetical protein
MRISAKGRFDFAETRYELQENFFATANPPEAENVSNNKQLITYLID